MVVHEMLDGYHIFTENDWLASFKTNGEARDYIAELINGRRSILGDCYRDANFRVFKGTQQLTFETNVTVCIGGY